MLSPEDFSRVTKAAYSTWTAFLASPGGTTLGHSPESLFALTTEVQGRIIRPQINPTAQALFVFCAEKAQFPFWLLTVPTLYPFAPPSEILDPENITSGWARTGNSVNVRILQFKGFLRMVDYQEAGHCSLRVLLHEIGHVCLHGDDLWPKTVTAPPSLPIASPKQEEEAWLFADTILGLARGENAATARSQGKIGDVWKR